MAYPGEDKPFFIASLAEKTSHNYLLILFFQLFILYNAGNLMAPTGTA